MNDNAKKQTPSYTHSFIRDFATVNFVKESDKFYWNLTKERIASEISPLLKKVNAMVVIAAATAGISVIGWVFTIWFYLK